LRNLLASLLIIGLAVATVGIAIGRFYRTVPIVRGGLITLPSTLTAPHGTGEPRYPPVQRGVALTLAIVGGAVVVMFLVQLVWTAFAGGRPTPLARAAARTVQAGILLALLGVGIPAVVWISSWLTWHIGITRSPLAAAGGLGAFVSYVGVLAATLWRKKAFTSVEASVKKETKAVSAVLPNSMIQRLIIWIALLVLILAALLSCGWIASSGLDDSWWAFAVVVPLVVLATFLDQTSMSLHPFYRRRLASAFAVRRTDLGRNGSGRYPVAVPYPESEVTQLSRYARKRDGFPVVTFAASANLNGQDRSNPGRKSVSYTLGAEYVGGPQVGWVRSDFLEEISRRTLKRDLTVEAAMAISGAAFASAMGAQTRYYELFLTLANARLGAWLPNPYFVALKAANLRDWTVPGLPRIRRLSYFVCEIFGIHPTSSRMLLCTDGGHYENLGLVELLRRRCSLNFCFDASGSTRPLADTLAGAMKLAREELGVKIDSANLYQLIPGSGAPMTPESQLTNLNNRISASAVVITQVHYPETEDQKSMDATLIFAQADLTRDCPYEVLEYVQDDGAFPNDGTADQWFDCDHFDAYQELGRYLGQTAFKMVPTHLPHSNGPATSTAAAQAQSPILVGSLNEAPGPGGTQPDQT
jgi:hypothetical protein